MDAADEAWRFGNVGRLMNTALTRFERRILTLMAERGHDEVPPSHLHLTRNLDRAGTRITELARRATMTKQAMSEIVAQCEAAGLVRREADPRDARARVVRFTDAGLAWLDVFHQALVDAEREMALAMGEGRLAGIKDALNDYTAL